MSKQSLLFKRSSQWNMLIDSKRLFITKGGDELYLIEELTGDAITVFHQAYKTDSLHELYTKSSDQPFSRVIDKLEKVGVVYRKNKAKSSSKPIRVSLRWIGSTHQKIVRTLTQFAKESGKLHLDDTVSTADLLVIIRTSGTLSAVLGDYKDIHIPHLFIDIAYDHTVSMGPFVLPGHTACLGCFVGRITRNWGDAEAPETPAVTENHEHLIASLILEHILSFQKNGNCPELVEKALSINLLDFTTQSDTVFRVPWCPICYPSALQEGLGSYELPWRNIR